MDKKPVRIWRFALGFGAPTMIALVCYLVYNDRLHIPCMFYGLTGFYCPGCGTGRAINAYLHGRIIEGFLLNPMLLILGIPSSIVLLLEYLRLVFPCLHRKPVFLSQPITIGCTVLLIVYWIARNIPALSFLAPGVV